MTDREPANASAANRVAGASADHVVVAHPQRSPLAMICKRLVQTAFLGWVAPRLLIYWVNQWLWSKDKAYLSASEGIALVPGARGVYSRQAFYRATLAQCGRDVYFGWLSVFSMPAASVGEGVYIGRRCNLGLVSLDDDVMLADGVQVLSGGKEHLHSPGPSSATTGAWIDRNHPPMDVQPAAASGTSPSPTYQESFSPPFQGGVGGVTAANAASDAQTTLREQPQHFHRVRIGKGAWIGAGAIIMADVGAHSIIGAGAVVTRPVPPHCIAVGVPAKVVKQL